MQPPPPALGSDGERSYYAFGKRAEVRRIKQDFERCACLRGCAAHPLACCVVPSPACQQRQVFFISLKRFFCSCNYARALMMLRSGLAPKFIHSELRGELMSFEARCSRMLRCYAKIPKGSRTHPLRLSR